MKIKDLHYEQCCCCTCGTITIYAVDNDTPVLYISGIPGGREVFDKLRDSWNATNVNPFFKPFFFLLFLKSILGKCSTST